MLGSLRGDQAGRSSASIPAFGDLNYDAYGALIAKHTDHHFRQFGSVISVRGREVSRIEGFSDAVFGFALTLLVASIEVPPDFEALKQTLRGFLPFALTFALISWIWYLHYSFFRQFGLEDRLTIVLNSVLLFVVLFFVYPLKVDGQQSRAADHGIGESGFGNLTEYDNRFLMVCYSSGVIAVFLVFFLLNWNAYRQRASVGTEAGGSLRHRHGAARARREHVARRDVDHARHVAADDVVRAVRPDLRPGGTAAGDQWVAQRVATRARVFPSSTPARQ